jgi:5'-nucleotidase
MLYRPIGLGPTQIEGDQRVDSRRSMQIVAATLVAAVVAVGCGGGDDQPSIPQSGVRETTTSEATTTTAAGGSASGPLSIVVTNDDGFGAPGINALVTALTAMDGVEVTVVAPATQQSGTGGSVTEGALATSDQTLENGHAATAVTGFPADTIRVAFDDMALQPDLVISGINEGQNLGPVVDVSGTVGAARAAVRKGVPALAVSQGVGQTFDYDVAAQLVVDWINENRDAIASGELPTDDVLNLNVPSCDTGELRGTLEVDSATSGDALAASNCTSTADGFTDDVTGFANGFATLTHVPVEPAAAA